MITKKLHPSWKPNHGFQREVSFTFGSISHEDCCAPGGEKILKFKNVQFLDGFMKSKHTKLIEVLENYNGKWQIIEYDDMGHDLRCYDMVADTFIDHTDKDKDEEKA